jgi:hypothetical protein
MGLYKDKFQSIFTGSYILPSADDKKKDQRIKGKGTNKKGKKERKKKLSIKKHSIPRLRLGDFNHKKIRAELPEGRNMS